MQGAPSIDECWSHGGFQPTFPQCFSQALRILFELQKTTGEDMEIRLKRVYLEKAEQDGRRILTERLWPRGISKQDAGIDQWVKELAPSTELRKWYGHDESKWSEFKKRYRLQLAKSPELRPWIEQLKAHQRVTLVYASKGELNSSVVLRQVVLEALREEAAQDSSNEKHGKAVE